MNDLAAPFALRVAQEAVKPDAVPRDVGAPGQSPRRTVLNVAEMALTGFLDEVSGDNLAAQDIPRIGRDRIGAS